MRLVVQRVSEACVTVNNKIKGKISQGLVVLIGITHNDTKANADYLVKKLINLRIFHDENKKMNKSIKDVNGELLLISQFTLYANCKDGNRPSFTDAASPDKAEEIYEYFVQKCKNENITVQTGVFGAEMYVNLTNHGPVTIILEKD